MAVLATSFLPIVKNYHHVALQIHVYFLIPLVLTLGHGFWKILIEIW